VTVQNVFRTMGIRVQNHFHAHLCGHGPKRFPRVAGTASRAGGAPRFAQTIGVQLQRRAGCHGCKGNVPRTGGDVGVKGIQASADAIGMGDEGKDVGLHHRDQQIRVAPQGGDGADIVEGTAPSSVLFKIMASADEVVIPTPAQQLVLIECGQLG